MGPKLRLWLLAALLVPLAGAAAARDLAILLVNERYSAYPNVSGTDGLLALEDPLRRVGFDVVAVRDFRSADMLDSFPNRWRRLRPEDRLLIVAAGHVVRTSYDAWLLAGDAENVDVVSVGRQGLSLGALMKIAGNRPGRAILAVARPDEDIKPGFGLRSDDHWIVTPQGVTVIHGRPTAVSAFVRREVLTPGRILFEAGRAQDDVQLRGYVSRTDPFLSAAVPADTESDRSAWRRASGRDTVAAYQDYLDRFPSGRFAAEAARRIEDLQLTPEDRARLAESELNLTRDQRRKIQSDLSILGFDPRGIDGIFGRGTRRAISDWQASIGLPAVGYLTANQITRLDGEAAERRARLAAEAERRRAQQEREDRAYWSDTGASGTERGLRAYLERYPDGLYAETAQEQLDRITESNRRRARAADRQAWDLAVSIGTVEAYRDYARSYPDGQFVDEARARIRNLTSPETLPDVIEQARAQEAALQLSPVSRRLIEARLAQLNYEPGIVDGSFDRNSRRAIRRFQRDNGIPVTGYVTRATVVRLVVNLDL